MRKSVKKNKQEMDCQSCIQECQVLPHLVQMYKLEPFRRITFSTFQIRFLSCLHNFQLIKGGVTLSQTPPNLTLSFHWNQLRPSCVPVTTTCSTSGQISTCIKRKSWYNTVVTGRFPQRIKCIDVFLSAVAMKCLGSQFVIFGHWGPCSTYFKFRGLKNYIVKFWCSS